MNQKIGKSRLIIGWVIVALILASTGAWLLQSGHQLQDQKSAEEQLALGKKIFRHSCSSCHGQDAVGEDPDHVSGGMKEAGGYWAPALNGTAHSWHHPPDVLFQTIKYGSMAQDSQMKGFQDRLSDPEIQAVIGYIQSLWPQEIQKRYREMNP